MSSERAQKDFKKVDLFHYILYTFPVDEIYSNGRGKLLVFGSTELVPLVFLIRYVQLLRTGLLSFCDPA